MNAWKEWESQCPSLRWCDIPFCLYITCALRAVSCAILDWKAWTTRSPSLSNGRGWMQVMVCHVRVSTSIATFDHISNHSSSCIGLSMLCATVSSVEWHMASQARALRFARHQGLSGCSEGQRQEGGEMAMRCWSVPVFSWCLLLGI